MQKNKVLSLLFLLALFIFCLVLAAIVFLVIQIPSLAQEKFGQPDSSLDTISLYRYSFLLYLHESDLIEPADRYGLNEVPFEVYLGEDVYSISERLESSGLIKNAEIFRTYLIYSGLDKSVQAGNYRLQASDSGIQIARNLQDATPLVVPFQILSGWRLEEIAASLPSSGIEITPEEFLAAAYIESGEASPFDYIKNGSLEGYLFPGAYEVDRTISSFELIKKFTGRFSDELSDELISGFESQGLNVMQAVTLASIVEKEGVIPAERPLIASVFLNRLNLGMKLESDPTVQYAVGYVEASASWWKNPLTYEDLEIDSPYNTYRYEGLPPGPICNPDMDSLRAVAFPEESTYLYFQAACDGSGTHNFSHTYEEHLLNICQ